MSTFGNPAPQWTDTRNVAGSVTRGVVYKDADGDWAVSSNPADSTGRVLGQFFVDSAGDVALDTVANSLTPTLSTAFTATDTFVY